MLSPIDHRVVVDQHVLDQLYGLLLARGYTLDCSQSGITIVGPSCILSSASESKLSPCERFENSYLSKCEAVVRDLARERRIARFEKRVNARNFRDEDGRRVPAVRFASFPLERARARAMVARKNSKMTSLDKDLDLDKVAVKHTQVTYDDIIEVDRHGNAIEANNM